MKKAYFGISYANRNLFDNEIKVLSKLFSKYDIELLVFVDIYNFNSDQETEMMETAFKEIDNSDILIAELTSKSIGVGIEIGYAVAKEKPIVYLKRMGSEYSTTAAGCSNYVIEYSNELELGELVEKTLGLK